MDDLPADLTTRPLTMADAPMAATLIGAEEIVALGYAEITAADLVADWQRPSFDPIAGTIGVFEQQRLVGYAAYSGSGNCDAAVDPGRHGRSIGTALARWCQERARADGAPRVGMQVPQGSAADRFLERHGYRLRWTAWDLELPPSAQLDAARVPAGFRIREATTADYDVVWQVMEDAFLEWSDRDRASLEDFLARTLQRPGFAPSHLRVVVDSDGTVVGAAYAILEEGTGDVERLAVRATHRRRGLARALLADTFATLREQGAPRDPRH
ncbi:GNAT family N-acetyltransferase [Allobranchiibius sp. CTAmp26]|uniref:GNAT family N-acetyltransferase n=1 Tax=Allobranchiibius sp. CTAmp26 TaxID=2815214 RepID=UPI001AA15D1B|nr:GNAT family N-acetyltransferase [Allobranchiibius sp. CTAmp26]MBO1754262.1 GNAT family N-acetyltransferase [Allobranchiibius sp. CTAmp26]